MTPQQANIRRRFADFLNELADGHRDPAKWHELIIEHYVDRRLEEIRVEIGRHNIANTLTPELLRQWAHELRNSGPATQS